MALVLICVPQLMSAGRPMAAPIGGSRALAPAVAATFGDECGPDGLGDRGLGAGVLQSMTGHSPTPSSHGDLHGQPWTVVPRHG